MRRRLALVFFAITLMLVLGLLVPLGLSVRSQAELRALGRAEADARAVATSLAVLASSESGAPSSEQIQFVLFTYAEPRIAILTDDGGSFGQRPEGFDNALARGWAGESFIARGVEGALALVPVSLGGAPSILVTASVPNSELQAGVRAAWTILTGLGLLVTVAVVPVGNSLANSLIRPVEALSRAARAWASGDLSASVEPGGPPELVDSGEAFNQLVVRLSELLTAEREKMADVSHRLRTPLTALRLQAETMTDSESKETLLADVDALEQAVTNMIEEVRNPAAAETECDLAAVTRERIRFWEVAAAAQDRSVVVSVPTSAESVVVGLGRREVITIVDTLVQNVFRHTPQGTNFYIGVSSSDRALTIRDDGPGFDSLRTPQRGRSSSESTGLGLDIVRRVAQDHGAEIEFSNDQGAVIRIVFSGPK